MGEREGDGIGKGARAGTRTRDAHNACWRAAHEAILAPTCHFHLKSLCFPPGHIFFGTFFFMTSS